MNQKSEMVFMFWANYTTKWLTNFERVRKKFEGQAERVQACSGALSLLTLYINGLFVG